MKTTKIKAPIFFIISATLILTYGCEKNEENIVTDIDGNKYHTVTIGTQVWMVENLRTSRYCNGDTILEEMSYFQWPKLTEGARCYYNDYDYALNHDTYNTIVTYGYLYNWYAVNDSRKIAPEGWHVATVDDWNTLINYVGGEDVAAGKLKETGTNHWNTKDDNTTNEFGFTALPGGLCTYRGHFEEITTHGYWWTASESDEDSAFAFLIYCFMDMVYGIPSVRTGILGPEGSYKNTGCSVRCVKD